MPSPKKRFQQSKQSIDAHAEYITSSIGVHALDMAMLQLSDNMAPTNETQHASANYHRMEGARQFRSILENLHIEFQMPPEDPGIPTLNYKV